MKAEQVTEWSAGDRLVVSATKLGHLRDITHGRQTIIALEPGFGGGWDVFDGRTGGDCITRRRLVSFYGFQVVAVIKINKGA